MNKIPGLPDRRQSISRPSSPVNIPVTKKPSVKFSEVVDVPLLKPAPVKAAPAPVQPVAQPRERRGSFGGLQTLTKSLTCQGDEIARLETIVKQQAATVARYEQSIKDSEVQIKESLTLIERQEAHLLKLEEALDDVING